VAGNIVLPSSPRASNSTSPAHRALALGLSAVEIFLIDLGTYLPSVCPPAKRLVGIELNPGPIFGPSVGPSNTPADISADIFRQMVGQVHNDQVRVLTEALDSVLDEHFEDISESDRDLFRLFGAAVISARIEILKKLSTVPIAVSRCSDEGGWVRDLTQEGVEPNPGPKSRKVIKGKGDYVLPAKQKVKKALLTAALRPRAAGFSGTMRGRGDYQGDLTNALIGALGPPGTELVTKGVGAASRWLSDKFKWLTGKIFGSGDYNVVGDPGTVSSNSVVVGSSPPQMHDKGRAFVFRHREYLTDILSSSAFSLLQFPLNPGQYDTFPWLAPIASNFEQWQYLGCLFEFKSLTSPISTNSSGAVIMATEYNPLKPAYTSKTQMENSEFACSGRPIDCILHAVECAVSDTQMNVKNVRIGLGAGGDLRFSDQGLFMIASQGQVDGSTAIGELWQTYEIAFYKPIYNSGLGLGLLTDVFALPAQNIVAATDVPWTAATRYANSLLGTSIEKVGVEYKLVFPRYVTTGRYMVSLVLYPSANWSVDGVVLTGTNPLSAADNCTNTPFFVGIFAPSAAGGVIGATDNGGRSQLMATCVVDINAPGAAFATVYLPVFSGAITNSVTGQIIVTQINGNVP